MSMAYRYFLSEREKLEKALKVLVLTPAIRDWLKANDPKALEQAKKALKRQTYTIWIRAESGKMEKVATCDNRIEARIMMNRYNSYVELRSSGKVIDWLEAW